MHENTTLGRIEELTARGLGSHPTFQKLEFSDLASAEAACGGEPAIVAAMNRGLKQFYAARPYIIASVRRNNTQVIDQLLKDSDADSPLVTGLLDEAWGCGEFAPPVDADRLKELTKDFSAENQREFIRISGQWRRELVTRDGKRFSVPTEEMSQDEFEAVLEWHEEQLAQSQLNIYEITALCDERRAQEGRWPIPKMSEERVDEVIATARTLYNARGRPVRLFENLWTALHVAKALHSFESTDQNAAHLGNIPVYFDPRGTFLMIEVTR